MIDIIEITIEEFKSDIYSKYLELFPEDERRPLIKLTNSYNAGVEKFYKIVLDSVVIGFLTLEKIKDLPFYLDYFAIFKEYQDKGYGTKALEILLKKLDNELIGEIEKEDASDQNTIKRFQFYKKLGFRKIDSEYLVFDVHYTPIIYSKAKMLDKEKLDKIFFEYYRTNSEKEDFEVKCKLIK